MCFASCHPSIEISHVSTKGAINTGSVRYNHYIFGAENALLKFWLIMYRSSIFMQSLRKVNGVRVKRGNLFFPFIVKSPTECTIYCKKTLYGDLTIVKNAR
jgi:hypothetical protein